MTTLSIIILSYNTKDLTLRCIRSIIEQYQKELEDETLEIIVVDNASSDASASQISNLKSQISNLGIIQNKENFGFAKGCNIGAKEARGRYILFLNSDTEVKDRGFLKMTDFLESNNDIGILGGRLLNSDSSSQPSGGNFYNLWNLFLTLIGGERFGLVRRSPKRIEKVDWVSGACMMIKKKLFDKLSGFDEHFFMYIEDMELCFRARKLGLLTFFYPDCKVKHISHASSNKTFAIINIYKGILYFYSKHKSSFEYITVKILLIAKAEILILVGLLTFNKSLIDRYTKAIV